MSVTVPATPLTSPNERTSAVPLRQRVDSVDVVRGVIMILMALDHTRDFFGNASASPTNLATTTVALFFTRWVTHFCAPTFFLLTGTSAYLAGRRRTVAGLSRFLVTRGLWLIVLELTVIRFLWQFNLDYRLTLIDVIWALGWAMIVLGLLVRLPVRAIAAFGLVLIATHNLFDGIKGSTFGSLAPLWSLLHVPGFIIPGPAHVLFSAYPLIPWIGVTAVGYALGTIWDMSSERRRALLLRMGVLCIALFLVLRGFNIYGDPGPWSVQPRGSMTLLSFINVNKYPPSLLFLLMTLGPVLLALRALEGQAPSVLKPAQIIGKVPFFYYLMHVLVLHVAAACAMLVRLGSLRPALESPSVDKFPMTQPPGWPVSLPVVYLIWIGAVLVLYPMCVWYAGVKQRSNNPWLSYL
ncbi:MAG: heparan-alpha-glucosaminide N-acetyltransferase domain-containing protein [Gemmatimonadota bacterium]|nr:heparan-alpha-glucosaminide N-acetyltransferase domain-containing protein [Gemmatimonadota bacterium]